MIQGEQNDNNFNIKKKKKQKVFLEVHSLKKVFNEIKKGVSGIVTKPNEGTKKEGINRLFKGIGKGVMGIALTLDNTILTIGMKLLKEFANSKLINNKVDYYRFREPIEF